MDIGEKKEINIILFMDRDFSIIGGDEVYFNNFLKYIDIEKYLIQIYTPEKSNLNSVQNRKYRVVTYSYKQKVFHNFFRFLNPLLKLVCLYNATKNKLKKSGNSVMITSDYLPILAAFFSNRRIKSIFVPGSLVTFDFLFDIDSSGGFFYQFSRKLQRFMITALEFFTYRLSSFVIVSTKFSKSNIMNYFHVRKKKIYVIPIGIDLASFIAAGEFRKKNKKIILSVGRLVKSKNIQMAIDAMRYLSEDYIWFVLGEGPEKNTLLDKIKEENLEKRFFLLGQKKDVQRYYKACDVFVHLSYHENFGLVLLEAMHYGKPPIVLRPDLPGVFTASSEIISNGYNGFFVDNCAEKIAAKIKEVSAMNMSEISNNCSEFIRQYSFENHLKGLCKLIESNANHA